MIRIRAVEDRIAELVEQGKVGCPCHVCIGTKPLRLASVLPCDRTTTFATATGHGHYLAKDGDLTLGPLGESIIGNDVSAVFEFAERAAERPRWGAEMAELCPTVVIRA